MLYVTTRQREETYTALRTLLEDSAPDGGGFMPMQVPELTARETDEILSLGFSDCVARILNLFFSARLSGEALSAALNWEPAALPGIGQRIYCGELWHNESGCLRSFAEKIVSVILRGEAVGLPTEWGRISVRIALLTGLLAVLRQSGVTENIDIACACGDFSTPMAAWYVRRMGFPVGTIICGCNENSALWDLLHRGELKTAGLAVKTLTPMADLCLPDALEYLISECGGVRETARYLDACRRGAVYVPTPDAAVRLQSGMFVAVVSDKRMLQCISNVYRSCGTLLSPYSALACAGLSDYRATKGEMRPALLLAEESPLYCADTVAKAISVPADTLAGRLKGI